MVDTEQSPFGSLLRAKRVAAGLTQEELSARSGITARGIRMLERGQHPTPRLETVRLLAAGLELNPDEIRTLLCAARPIQATSPHAATRGDTDSRSGAGRSKLGNIPAPIDTLIGRDSIVADTCAQLRNDNVRLLTITGPPGIGKSRVALAIARQIQDVFVGGSWVVWLAPVTDMSLVLPRIYEVICGPSTQRDVTVDVLAHWIGDVPMLLLLDNLEHLLDAALFIPELLSLCPGLVVIATSRAQLSVSGERRLRLPTLSIRAADQHHNGTRPGLSDAEQLFILRARNAGVELELDEVNAQLIAIICQRLDGLPLAIELAAAQLGFRSLQDLAGGIEHILPKLTGGPRDQPKRLQTMTASLEWSTSLLSAEEQRLLYRLSVFRGGFDLQSAISVSCGTVPTSDEGPESESTTVLLKGLVEKSLVARVNQPIASLRYGLLELVREFGEERLREAGEESAAREAHARYFFDLAERHASVDWIPGEPGLPQKFAEELPNLRTALGWLEAIDDGERMLRFAGALDWFWNTHNHAIEGRQWLERAIAIGANASPAAKATAALVLAQVESYLGDHQRSDEQNAIGLHYAVEANEPFLLAWACVANAAMVIYCGDYLRGKELCLRAMDVFDQIEDEQMLLGIRCWTPGTLARAEHGLGNLEVAGELLREAVQLNMDLGQLRGAARFIGNQGTLAFDQGDFRGALERYLHGAALAHQDHDDVYAATNLRMAAAAYGMTGQPRLAARLLGAIQTFEQQVGPLVMWTPMDLRAQQQGGEAMRHSMEEAALDRELSAGRLLSLAEAAAEASVAARNFAGRSGATTVGGDLRASGRRNRRTMNGRSTDGRTTEGDTFGVDQTNSP